MPSRPLPSDMERARRGVESWREAAQGMDDPAIRDWAQSYVVSADGRVLLEGIFGNSPFLSGILIRAPSLLYEIVTQGADTTLSLLLDDLQTSNAEADTGRFMAALRHAKRKAAGIIAWADIAGEWPLERVTSALSDFADRTVQLSVRHLLRKAAVAGLIDVPDPENPENGSGLVILGMGKLGARELNYSSDIDLIVFYDDAAIKTRQPEHLARTYTRLARDLVRIMEERTADGYVFRCDLRLRPDPGSTPLAVTLSAAETYYGGMGQNWERAAMIKARPIAGDEKAIRDTMDILRHFVWRRSLDFAAIQDIHSIKRQIAAHRGHRVVTVNGHNIKVGRGGIREIEFYAQTQQLIYGGRDTRLRTQQTCAALDALVEAHFVTPEARSELIVAYTFLRTLEHRLQMVDDHQTHELPGSDEGVASIAAFLGYADVDAFRRDLLDNLSLVEDHYARLFEHEAPLSGPGNLVFTGTEDDPETLKTLTSLGYSNPSAVAATVRGWHHGRYRATRSARARELLTELIPAILTAFAKALHPDEAFLRFDNFLGRLPTGVQPFALFQANPWLLDLMAELFGCSPALADTLSRNPGLLDAVLAGDFFAPLPDLEALEHSLSPHLNSARDLEDVLNLLRIWNNEQKLRAGIHTLRRISDIEACGRFLANVAETILKALLPHIVNDLARRHGHIPGGRIAILGLGRLGERQMTLSSDMDLIVVYDAPDDVSASDGERPLSVPEYAIRLTQRLTSALTTQTGEGRLYDVDMRLRPSGNAGPLAVRLSAFRDYQMTQAWTWEHMALCRARAVAGDPALCAELDSVIRNVLIRPRDKDALMRDCIDMRQRMNREFGSANTWKLKTLRGGLIDIEFLSQYLLLAHAARHSDIVSTDMSAILQVCADEGLIDLSIAVELIEGRRFCLTAQAILRLVREPNTGARPPDGAATVLAQHLLPDTKGTIDLAAVEAKITAVTSRCFRQIIQILPLGSTVQRNA